MSEQASPRPWDAKNEKYLTIFDANGRALTIGPYGFQNLMDIPFIVARANLPDWVDQMPAGAVPFGMLEVGARFHSLSGTGHAGEEQPWTKTILKEHKNYESYNAVHGDYAQRRRLFWYWDLVLPVVPEPVRAMPAPRQEQNGHAEQPKTALFGQLQIGERFVPVLERKTRGPVWAKVSETSANSLGGTGRATGLGEFQPGEPVQPVDTRGTPFTDPVKCEFKDLRIGESFRIGAPSGRIYYKLSASGAYTPGQGGADFAEEQPVIKQREWR